MERRVAVRCYDQVSQSHCCAGVRVTMSASIEDRSDSEPNCSWDSAPMAPLIFAMKLARIFSKVFPRHDSGEIGLRFLGLVMSVCSSCDMGTHFAVFHAGGNVPCCVRLEKKPGRVSGEARWTAATIL